LKGCWEAGPVFARSWGGTEKLETRNVPEQGGSELRKALHVDKSRCPILKTWEHWRTPLYINRTNPQRARHDDRPYALKKRVSEPLFIVRTKDLGQSSRHTESGRPRLKPQTTGTCRELPSMGIHLRKEKERLSTTKTAFKGLAYRDSTYAEWVRASKKEPTTRAGKEWV